MARSSGTQAEVDSGFPPKEDEGKAACIWESLWAGIPGSKAYTPGPAEKSLGHCTVDLADGYTVWVRQLTEFYPGKSNSMGKVHVGH